MEEVEEEEGSASTSPTKTPGCFLVFPREESTSSHAFLFRKLQLPTNLSEISLFHCYIPSLETFDVIFSRFFGNHLLLLKGSLKDTLPLLEIFVDVQVRNS